MITGQGRTALEKPRLVRTRMQKPTSGSAKSVNALLPVSKNLGPTKQQIIRIEYNTGGIQTL